MNDTISCHRVAVIMAGGSGERFWPLSRKAFPKQLLPLTRPDQSVLQEAVARIAGMIAPADIYVQTMPHLQAPIRAAELGIPPENVIAEPCKRNTAGCLAYAAAYLMAKYDKPLSMAVLTADHAIGAAKTFLQAVNTALSIAEREPVLATIGVEPTFPSTGFGYVHANVSEQLGRDGAEVHPVRAFREKPDLESAQAYLASGDYFWNAGMFFWRADTFVDEFRHANVAYATAIEAMVAAMKAGNVDEVTRVFEGLESISIDYALMEKARRVVVVRARFPWDDIGTWPAVARMQESDAAGNIGLGDPVLVDCSNSIVYNAPGAEVMAVGVVGMDDIIVVTTKDAVLVIPRDRAEEVKEIVTQLKARNATQL